MLVTLLPLMLMLLLWLLLFTDVVVFNPQLTVVDVTVAMESAVTASYCLLAFTHQ